MLLGFVVMCVRSRREVEVWRGGASLEIRWWGGQEVLCVGDEVDGLRRRGGEGEMVGVEMVVEWEGGEGEVLREVLRVLRRGRGGRGGGGGVHLAAFTTNLVFGGRCGRAGG